MLPSSSRLSRSSFGQFLLKKDTQIKFNKLGTLKYVHNPSNKVSIVISSKNEKRAVYRNKIRRRLYSLFMTHFKTDKNSREYVLYLSKEAFKFEFQELKKLFYELLEKTTK